MEITVQTKERIKAQGYIAYTMGKHTQDCPYTISDFKNWWLVGYHQARRDCEKAQKNHGEK